MSDVMENQPKFLTVKQFADALGVHEQTVRLWDKQGKVKPHHRLPGGMRMYSQEQVDALMQGQELSKSDS